MIVDKLPTMDKMLSIICLAFSGIGFLLLSTSLGSHNWLENDNVLFAQTNGLWSYCYGGKCVGYARVIEFIEATRILLILGIVFDLCAMALVMTKFIAKTMYYDQKKILVVQILVFSLSVILTVAGLTIYVTEQSAIKSSHSSFGWSYFIGCVGACCCVPCIALSVYILWMKRMESNSIP